MADQPELDLGPTSSSASVAAAPRRRLAFAGLTKWQIAAVLLLIVTLVWAMWVTKTLTAKQEHIVSVRLSELVGEYVEAQRFSAAPPERVQAEMQAFMASLDKELQSRGAHGQIVLVGEAVLSKNVDDITDSLKQAVYASGVPVPRRATAQALQQMSAGQAVQVPAPGQMAAQPQFVPQMPTQPEAQAPALMSPGATVSTFGGPDANGGQ